MMHKKRTVQKIDILNKKALFNYHLLEEVTAGIVLKGSEIKSIRLGSADLKDAYCHFLEGELWVKGMRISHYKQGGIYYNHMPTRPRKLLLRKQELRRLRKKKEEKGLTIIPKRLFIDGHKLAKLQIALVRGKKLYDKREAIKERDLLRSVSKAH